MEQVEIYHKNATQHFEKGKKLTKSMKFINIQIGQAKYYPGEFLFSSLYDNVIEIMETCRVCSTLYQTLQTDM